MRLPALLAAGALGAPVLVGQPGDWPLPRLGYSAKSHVVQAQTGFAFRWRAPSGQRQGSGGRYYGVHLHGRVAIDPQGIGAVPDIVSSINGYVCSSDLIDAHEAGENVVLEWYAGPGRNGVLEAAGSAGAPALLVDDAATCILPSVHEGVNAAAVRATDFGPQARLTVLPDSGLVVTRTFSVPASARRRPGGVLLTASAPVGPVPARSSFDLLVQVAGAGEPLRAGSVTARAPSGPVRLAGSTVRRYRAQAAGTPVLLSFRVHALRPGRSWIALRAGPQRALVLVTIH